MGVSSIVRSGIYVRFQIPYLLSLGLGKYYRLRVVDFHRPKLFEDDITVMFDRFSSIKCLSITKNLVNAKLLVVDKLLLDDKLLADLFSVTKHLADTKHLANSEDVNRSDISAKSDNLVFPLLHKVGNVGRSAKSGISVSDVKLYFLVHISSFNTS